MKQVSDNIYTTEKGDLSITPSLEIILRFTSIKDAISSIPIFFQMLYRNHVIQLYSRQYNVILSNNFKDIYFEKNIQPDTLIQMEQAFKACINLPIRKKATLLTLFCYDEISKNNTEMFRLACSQNVFPDDPVIMSLQIFSDSRDSWKFFEILQSDIIKNAEINFFSSSIGYRFIVNIHKCTSGITAMRNLCMRYIGVDLDDSFSVHLPLWYHKIRTINWKTSLNISLINNNTTESNVLHWETGREPSICDRNAGKLSPLQEYKETAEKLKSIIYMPNDLLWLSEWQSDIYEKWVGRWNNVKYS